MSLISQLCMVGASCMALTIYLLIYLLKYGVPESVSATYYSELPKWAFSTTLAVAGGFLLIPWIEISEKTEEREKLKKLIWECYCQKNPNPAEGE